MFIKREKERKQKRKLLGESKEIIVKERKCLRVKANFPSSDFYTI